MTAYVTLPDYLTQNAYAATPEAYPVRDHLGPSKGDPILDVILKRLHASCEQAAVTHERACQLSGRLGLPHETTGETTPQPCGPGTLGSLETASRRLGELLSSLDRQMQELDRL